MDTYTIEVVGEVRKFYWNFLALANKRKGLKDLYCVRDERILLGLESWLHDHRNDFMINIENKECSKNIVVALSEGGFKISYDAI